MGLVLLSAKYDIVAGQGQNMCEAIKVHGATVQTAVFRLADGVVNADWVQLMAQQNTHQAQGGGIAPPASANEITQAHSDSIAEASRRTAAAVAAEEAAAAKEAAVRGAKA